MEKNKLMKKSNARQTEYIAKLKDPRWQQKRLKIFERDNWRCKLCLSKHLTLHVHHLAYTVEHPWEENDFNLVTYCETCHEEETKDRAEIERDLLKEMRIAGLHTEELRMLACYFSTANKYFDELNDKKWLDRENELILKAKSNGNYFCCRCKTEQNLYIYHKNVYASLPIEMPEDNFKFFCRKCKTFEKTDYTSLEYELDFIAQLKTWGLHSSDFFSMVIESSGCSEEECEVIKKCLLCLFENQDFRSFLVKNRAKFFA